MKEFSYGDKIFKLLQSLEEKINVPDLHSFKARIKSGTVFVEARQGEVYVNHECDNGAWRGWCGSYIAAANRRADHLPDTTKKVSNADRIRSMSDEELAKIITSDLIGELIPFCQNKYECDAMLTINTIPEEWCMKCALDWLKEEHNEAD